MTLLEAAQALSNAFSTADLNGDGRLSLSEILAAQPDISEAHFDALDDDGDRLISLSELEAHLAGDSATNSGCPGSKVLPVQGFQEVFGDLFLLGVALLSLAGWSRFEERR